MFKIHWPGFFFILTLFIGTEALLASDHIDKPTSEDPVTDITDMYSFQSPKDAEKVVFVLNTYTMPQKDAHLSTKVGASFVLREARFENKQWSYDSQSEKKITCRYKNSKKEAQHGPSLVECALLLKGSDGNNVLLSKAESKLDTVEELAANSTANPAPFRVFAGRRADPFIFNIQWTGAIMRGNFEGAHALKESGLKNTMERADTFSLVVEIDKKLIGGTEQILAVTAETNDLSADLSNEQSSWPMGKYPRFDRVGFPEVTNIILAYSQKPDQEDFRKRYNAQPVFDQDPEFRKEFVEYFRESLTKYDRLDGEKDWSDDLKAQASQQIMDDVLLLNLSSTSKIPDFGFFSLQKQSLVGETLSSRGGRRVHDDFMDDIFTLLIGGPKVNSSRYSDGVDEPNDPLPGEFPYLAEPNFF